MRNWKKYWISSNRLPLGMILAGLAFPQATSKACGPVMDQVSGAYTFVHPGLVNTETESAPYFLDFQQIYEQYGRQSRLQPLTNLEEWQERFCGIPDLKDIAYIVYQSPIEQMQRLETHVRNKKLPVPADLRNNSFAQYLDRNQCTEAVTYLIYAKRCEPYVVSGDPWKETDEANRKRAMEILIDEGLTAFRKTASHYFRLRYAYQIIRLAHYSGDYLRTLELHDFLMPKIDNDPSTIEYWIMGHRAGALMGLGKNVEASYLYSLIFEHCQGKRESAFRSFHIRNDEEWKTVLLMCRDDRERATLYALRANFSDSKAVEEMAAIHRLDPGNPHLDILLLKELKKMERFHLGSEFKPQGAPSSRDRTKQAQAYLIRLQEFVRKLNAAGDAPTPVLWRMAEGYLEVLAGDYYQAEKTLETVRRSVRSDFLREQIDAFLLTAKINSFRSVNDATEAEVAASMHEDKTFGRFPDFDRMLKDKMSWLYARQGADGKYFLQKYELQDLKVNPDPKLISKLLALIEKKDPNRYERYLLRENESGKLARDLKELEGTALLAANDLSGARIAYERVGRQEMENYGLFNPFREVINDCINCVFQDSFTLLTKLEITERMLSLENRALTDREQSAAYFYRIGLAYYNMSYFGYAWQALDQFRSGSSLTSRSRPPGAPVVPRDDYALGNRERFDCSIALDYFDRARQLAQDPELAAAATFMAAKCEQNRFFFQGGTPTYQYFELLRTEHANSAFFQKIIAECRYFRAYAAK